MVRTITTCPRRYLEPAADRLLATVGWPRRALFLDRDGVINVNHGYVHQAEHTDWLPGIFELCRDALALGYLPVVATNQAGIARGYYDERTFLAYTAWVHEQFVSHGVRLLATYYCPHHPTEGQPKYRKVCECRKPGPGMLVRAAADLALDLGKSILIGDSDSDLLAARAAGVGTAVKVEGSLHMLSGIVLAHSSL